MKKYEIICKDIEERINNNEFSETHNLPTEEKLVSYYHVSRNTIRLAINELKKHGKVYSRQGSGNFVRKNTNKDAILLTGTNGLAHDFPDNQLKTNVISIKILEADEKLANDMFCEIGTPIYYIKRIRIIDDKKFALELTYYNKNIVQYLDEEIASRSIYSYLKDTIELKFGFADKNVKAIKLDKEQSQLLELQEGDPALVIADTVYLENGELFNISKVIYNYKYANFYIPALR